MKRLRTSSFLLAAMAWQAYSVAGAQESRLVEQNGLVYQERTVKVQTPVAETQLVSQEQTTYEPKVVTELRDIPMTRWQPVTTNQWQERWQNPLGIRGPRQKVGQWVAVTRWEQRVEYVRQPVSYQARLPETRTVQVPVRSLRFEEKEQTESVLVGPASAYQQTASFVPNYSPAVVPRTPASPKFDDDKLRYGMKPTDASGWR